MEKSEIEELRYRVSCAAVLEAAGFALDVRESSRGSMKFRRAAEIIIVNHEGQGWFDPLSDAKGDVFSLSEHLDGGTFREVLQRIADLVGFVTSEPQWNRPAHVTEMEATVAERWRSRRKPWPGSATWRYLRNDRFLPDFIIRTAVRQDRLREGPHGSMWAAHASDAGAVTGWEERGPEWQGFSTGGAKTLFRLGDLAGLRICVTEAAIDAMSLAELEGLREGTLYVSTGGGWSPAAEAALRQLASRDRAMLVAATDNDSQGETYSDRTRQIAAAAGADWQRLKPPEQDWNKVLARRHQNRSRGRQSADSSSAPR